MLPIDLKCKQTQGTPLKTENKTTLLNTVDTRRTNMDRDTGFFGSIGNGMALAFTVLFVGAVGNGLSTYVPGMNGKSFRDVIDERIGVEG